MSSPIPPVPTAPQATATPVQQMPVQATATPLTADEMKQNLTAVDSSTGAPIGLRAAVGAATSETARVQTIRNWQKAHGIAQDAKPSGDGNYIYSTNDGPMVLFRPTKGGGFLGLNHLGGWEAEHLSDIAELGGQILGGGFGAVAGGTAGGPGGAIAGGMALGGAGGATAKSTAQGILSSLLPWTAPEDRSMGQQVGDAAASFGANAIGQGINMGLSGIGQVLGKAMTPAAQVADNTGFAATGQRLQNFADVGTTPTWAMASQTPFMRQVEAALTADPLTRGRMVGAYANAALGGQEASDLITQGLAGNPMTGATRMGTAASTLKGAMQEGSAQAVKDFSRTESQMSAIVENLTRGAGPLPPVNTTNYWVKLLNDDPNLVNTMPFGKDPAAIRTANILKDAAMTKGGLTFGQLQTLRTTTDALIDKAGGFGSDMEYTGPALNRLKGLRAALKDDLYTQAQEIDKANGFTPNPVQPLGPVADALKEHDAFVTAWHDSNKELSFGTFKDMMDTYGTLNPSDIQAAGTKDLGRTFLQMRNRFPPDQYNALSSVWFANLGRAVHGAEETWDPRLFTTNWKAAEPFRKNLLLGTDVGRVMPNIDKLVQAAQDMEKVVPKGNDPTVSMRVLAPLIGGAVGGGVEHLLAGSGAPMTASASLMGAIGLPWLASRAVTSPLMANTAKALLTSDAFLRAILPMAQATKTFGKEAAGLTFPMASRIWAVGVAEPRLKPAIDDYMQHLQESGVEIPNQPFQRLNTPSATFVPH